MVDENKRFLKILYYRRDETMPKQKFKFEIFKGSNGDYYTHIVASSGRIIMVSEGYENKADAISICVRLKEFLPESKIYDLTTGE